MRGDSARTALSAYRTHILVEPVQRRAAASDEKDKERAAHLGAPHRKQVRVLECDPHDDRFRQAGQTSPIPIHRNIEA